MFLLYNGNNPRSEQNGENNVLGEGEALLAPLVGKIGSLAIFVVTTSRKKEINSIEILTKRQKHPGVFAFSLIYFVSKKH